MKQCEPVQVEGIGGGLTVTMEGRASEFGKVLFDASAPVNVLSFAEVEKKFPISYASDVGFTVHVNASKEYVFKRTKKGMFVCDMSGLVRDVPPEPGEVHYRGDEAYRGANKVKGDDIDPAPDPNRVMRVVDVYAFTKVMSVHR
jgi:hypothetical protein